jgi:predicted SnoaL-like aldol condensation-catalyzing enzyme
MESATAKNPGKTCEIKQALEEGDKVMTLSHVRQHAEDLGAAVVHLFRFQNGKVVELWDLGQPVAKDSHNQNGPF